MAKTPQQKAAENQLGRRLITSTLFMMAMAAGVGLLVYYGLIDLTPEEVALDVEIAQGTSPSDGSKIPFTVDLSLTNNTSETVALSAPNRCQVFRWFVMTPQEAFVQGEGEEICAQVMVSGTLDPDNVLTERYRIELDPKRVKPGDYNLAVRFWDYEALEPFTVN